MPYLEIDHKDIVFDPKVQTFCNNPKFKCPNYGHSWACPPEAPYLEKEVSQFKKFFLVFVKFDLETYVKEQKVMHPRRSEEKLRTHFYGKELVRDLFEQEMNKFLEECGNKFGERLILWEGHCRTCNNPVDKGCTHDSGKGCRYPKKRHYSIEAVGINVDKTVKNAKIQLEWPPKKCVYRFGIVCFK